MKDKEWIQSDTLHSEVEGLRLFHGLNNTRIEKQGELLHLGCGQQHFTVATDTTH